LVGDKAYDSAELREELDERGTKPVIPNRSNRKQPFSFNKRLHKLRWRIASWIAKVRRTFCATPVSSNQNPAE
jgi:IS5 family transposase